jgi:hypothetical protein
MAPVIWVAEDVSEDAQDENMTRKQELMLLAGPGDSGFFRNELIKLLQAEQKEREEMQQQRVGRVRQWQQTVTQFDGNVERSGAF